MKSVCVFAGSNSGSRPEYIPAAEELGRSLARRQITAVYGGARVGLMGAMADAALSEGGRVIGVMPEALVAKEIAHQGLTELRVVKSMHERKTMMADLAGGFVAVPGGFGTLEEFFEVLTWGQLGFHGKPCGLLNIAGYYDKLLAFADHCVDEGFVRREHRAMISVSHAPEALLDAMAAYQPPVVKKWIERAET
ncbi:Rossman fold protein, TIGR00730 family [Betaproteobacteria bacterium GR16-43]|nr:Rossman fold protein, TIGR00730 family [Betaproteobacteria bacterium GR16-43]